MTTKALGLALLVLLMLAAPAGAANTWYASPVGSGTVCTQVAPCAVDEALMTKPVDGDTVVLAGGTYDIASGLLITKAVSIEAAPGATRPRIVGSPGVGHTLEWDPTASTPAPAHISGLDVTNQFAGGSALYVFNQGTELLTVDRVRAESSGAGAKAMTLSDPNLLLRDSVALATGANATAADVLGFWQTASTADVRNLTAVARAAGAEGIAFDPGGFFLTPFSFCDDLTATMKNVLARGNAPAGDIFVNSTDATFPTTITCNAHVASSHSNWRDKTVSPTADLGSTADQHNVDPVFVNEPAGDFHEGAGSPTIDAGVADPLNGLTDLDGVPRNLSAAPDIGAYESPFSVPAAGGGGSTVPPDTVAPAASSIRFGPTAFAPDRKGASIAAKRRVAHGSRVSFTVSEAATVSFSVKQPLKGRRSGRRCVTGRRARRLKGKRCTIFKSVGRPFSYTAKAGANSFHFTGRVSGKALRPGRYLLVGVARDAAGNVSKQFRGSFKIVRG